MKKVISLIVLTLFITSCSSVDLTTELEKANQEIGSLNTNIDNLTGEIDNLEDQNQQLSESTGVLEDQLSNLEEENNSLEDSIIILEEEIALSQEALEAIEAPADGETVDVKSYSQTGVLTGPYVGQKVMEAALDVIAALHIQDLGVLSSYVDPANGLKLAPSQNFDPNTLIQLDNNDIVAMYGNPNIYNWGNEQVTNNPINMTIVDYFSNYVYDELYIQASIIGQNNIVSTGSVVNSIPSTYFYSTAYVEFLIPEFYTSNPNSEWRSITLVFNVEDFAPKLLAIVHGY